jgi:hypothetical protein
VNCRVTPSIPDERSGRRKFSCAVRPASVSFARTGASMGEEKKRMARTTGGRPEDSGEYRFARIRLSSVGHAASTVTFEGSDDKVNWRTLEHHTLSFSPRSFRRNQSGREKGCSDGSR